MMPGSCGVNVALVKLLPLWMRINPIFVSTMRAVYRICGKVAPLLTRYQSMVMVSSIRSVGMRGAIRVCLLLMNGTSVRCRKLGLHVPVTCDGPLMIVSIRKLTLQMRY